MPVALIQGGPQDLRRRTKMTPSAEDPHTRIKPLALAIGHGRYVDYSKRYIRTDARVRWRIFLRSFRIETVVA